VTSPNGSEDAMLAELAPALARARMNRFPGSTPRIEVARRARCTPRLLVHHFDPDALQAKARIASQDGLDRLRLQIPEPIAGRIEPGCRRRQGMPRLRDRAPAVD